MINKLKTLVKNIFGQKDVAPAPVVEETKPVEPKQWEVKIVPVETQKPKQVQAKREPRPQPKQQPTQAKPKQQPTQAKPKQQSNNSQVKKPAVKQGTQSASPAKQAPKKTPVNKNKGDPNAGKSRTSK
jgi:hypothetical protein